MVSTSLFTGLSGLRSHQRFMDVIGNNLANVNTPGFWGSRVAFSDLLSFTMMPGNGPSSTAGGRNPQQVGLGSQVAAVDANTNQGTFLNTGRPLDVAIKGQGFFTLTDGDRTYYSRVGTFGVDADRNLVDTRTGMRVVDDGGDAIGVPLTGTLPAQMTSQVSFEGALPATVSGPLAEVLSSNAAWKQGTAATVTSTVTQTSPMNLSALNGNTFTVTANGGTPQTVTINATNFGGNLASVTFAQFITGIESQTNGISVSESSGVFSFATDKVGDLATIKFDNKSGTPLTTLGITTDLKQGTQSAATGTTDLNDLTFNNTDYVAGDTIAISGTLPNGNKVAATFRYGATSGGNSGTTVGELLTFLNSRFQSGTTGGATAAIASDGTLSLTADDKGEANLSLFIADSTSATKTNYSSFKVTRDGTGPDTVTTSIDVIDSLGRAHPVTMKFTRDTNDATMWNLAATMDANEGTILDGAVSQIRFNTDGSFNIVTDANQSLQFSFSGLPSAQTVALDFGNSGDFDGISMLGSKATAAATGQDGYVSGNLLNVAFNETGTLQGYYSNGKSRDIATLRIAMFSNPGGALRVGDTLLVESPNSNNAILTTAGNGGAGTVVSGVLENSNVDIAEEFVRLIEAQRGFQANARVITTTDQVLSELLNIVR